MNTDETSKKLPEGKYTVVTMGNNSSWVPTKEPTRWFHDLEDAKQAALEMQNDSKTNQLFKIGKVTKGELTPLPTSKSKTSKPEQDARRAVSNNGKQNKFKPPQL